MARYTARWSEIPLEQYSALPEVAQRQVDVRVAELLEEPQGPPQAYDRRATSGRPSTATAPG